MMPIEPFINTTYTEIARMVTQKEWGVTRRLLKRVSTITGSWTLAAGGVLAAAMIWDGLADLGVAYLTDRQGRPEALARLVLVGAPLGAFGFWLTFAPATGGAWPAVQRIDWHPLRVPTMFLLGDSTVADQSSEPYASWGQMLPRFFSPEVAIASAAGESARTRPCPSQMRMAFESVSRRPRARFNPRASRAIWVRTAART